jgi:AraC family transcriptional regulator of adaptative response/methylated-DNA-[protein]-cysteine methyltransferase
MPKFETEASRWAAVQSRDSSADGSFVYSVKTTGIYCRPICKARLARRSNVSFHNDSKSAEADGFRPCMRCKPELERYDPQSEVISRACSTMQASAAQGKESTLKDLANEAGLTQSHFHRVFKSVMGVTPKTHAAALLGKNRAIAEVPSSRPGSLTPSLGRSSSASNGPLTPCVLPTPPAIADWQDACALEATEAALMTKISSDCLQSQIEVTIQPWQSGYVLIAATKDVLRAIDVGDNDVDLLAMMQRRFPAADLLLSGWAKNTTSGRFQTPTERLFDSVMEALENPTGKVLHLPTSIFEVYG